VRQPHGRQAAQSLSLQGGVSQASSDAIGEAYFLFLQGRALEGRGDVDGAIRAYREALEKAPDTAEIRAELAGLYARVGQADLSIAEAEAALAVEPGNREAHRILGFVQAALADRPGGQADRGALVTAAIEHLTQALAGGVRDPGAELTLGRLYVGSGSYEEAVRTLTAFLIDQPGYPEGMLLLATAHEGVGDPGEAAAVLARLVAQSPDQVAARVRLGELYEQSTRWAEAAAVWRELADDSPGGEYRTRYAAALVNGGDLAGGRRELVAVTRDAPRDISAWYLLSQVERRAGNADEAERAAREIAAIDPDDARGTLALAESYAARGEYERVVEVLQPRVDVPGPTDVREGMYGRMAADLALALDAAGQKARAVEVLERACARVPGDPVLAFGLAAAFERVGRLNDAERAFKELIDADPTNAGALNYLGYMLADRGEKLDEAVDFISRALAIEPANPSYLDSLGWAHFKRGRLDLALDPLKRAAAGLPEASIIQDHLGDVYFGLKRYREAAGAWDRALAGDREDLDIPAVTAKRDRARELAGRE
jgi:tetratricopeptide (TPR) repeat protein